jgi:methionyl-tRNA synthetase
MARYLVTAALPYANGPLHIGHLAGCYIPADIYVRYLRLKGEDVLFICGSDEHGVPITIKAKQEGISPQQVVDYYHQMMKKSFEDFGISFDHYSRTSAAIHHKTAQQFFKTLYDKNVFKEEITQQYFDEEAKQFLADRYITGTCPKCGFENAYGDQCENCGSSLSPAELINPKSKLSGSTPVLKPTKNWFLPMDEIQKSEAFQQFIRRFDNWKPNVRGQCLSWLNEGLQPRAMTRDLDWGVKLPLPDTEGKVLYVWFDAPIGYISATKEFAPDKWELYWKEQKNKSDNARLIHFIGKDNIVFHAIIFPMMLIAHGGFILPDNVPANEFLNLEGDKISTSRHWAVWLHEYLTDFPGREDELRYVLTSIAPETKDSEFTWKDFQARVNNELVAIFGNFVNRTLVLTGKFFEGKIPPRHELNESDKALLAGIVKTKKEIETHLEKFRQREALAALIDLARAGNKYLADTEPWKLIKTDEKRVETILHLSLQLTAALGILSAPFLPKTSEKIFSMLNTGTLNWQDAEKISLPAGKLLGTPALLYEKLEDSVIENQIAKLRSAKPTPAATNPPTSHPSPQPVKETITFDDFQKLNIITATILEAERVPKTDKLMKLLLDTGSEKRTVVSGIAHCYEPAEVIGRQVLLLANLAPRKIKGIESKGMILMASDKDGKLVFATTSANTSNGAIIS